MSSIISKTSLEKLESIRKYVLKAAIWLLVGGVVLGAITILIGGSSSGEIISKFIGTMFIVALMMMISVNNFKQIAIEDPSIQTFALIGLISNLVWTVLWTLLCWDPELGWVCETTKMRAAGSTCVTGMSVLFKFALISSSLSALGLLGSNVLAIYEGKKKSMIRPLKITAVICATYELMFFILAVSLDFNFRSEFLSRLGMLAGFAGFAWFSITIVALILSSNEKSKNKAAAEKKVEDDAEGNTSKPKKTEAELRAEIEEQVRREMIEKEVRKKIEAEKKAGSNGDKDIESNKNTRDSEKSA